MEEYDLLVAKIKGIVEERRRKNINLPEIFNIKSVKFNVKKEIDRIKKEKMKVFTLIEVVNKLINKGINGIDILAIIILSGMLEKYEKFIEQQENDIKKIIEELGGKENLIQLAKEKLKVFLYSINDPRFIDIFNKEKFVLDEGQGISQGASYVNLSAGQVYRFVLKVKEKVSNTDFLNTLFFITCHEFAHRMTSDIDIEIDDRERLSEGLTREFANFYCLSAEHKFYKKNFKIELKIEKKKHSEDTLKILGFMSAFLKYFYPDAIVNGKYKYLKTSYFIDSRTMVPIKPYLEEMDNETLEEYLKLSKGTLFKLSNDNLKNTLKTVLTAVEKIVKKAKK